MVFKESWANARMKKAHLSVGFFKNYRLSSGGGSRQQVPWLVFLIIISRGKLWHCGLASDGIRKVA
jgi:hypothetical protein